MNEFMTVRERFHAVMNFQSVDRLPMIEWAVWWKKTIERWHGEGLPLHMTDRYDLYRYFGLDVYYQDWIRPWKKECPEPSHHGAPIIRSHDDYEKIKPFLYPRPVADPVRWKQWAAEQKRGDAVIWITWNGFFSLPRWLMGIEPHLYAFYDEPELMHQINSDLAEWMLRVLEEICTYAAPDFMTFAEDLSYNHGPMLSKEHFHEFLAPYYRRIIPALQERGILTFIDSDGDVTEPAFWFEEIGFEGILPLERQAGVDVTRLRREHPRMQFIGHFDKMTMTQGREAMRAEFERLSPVIKAGGFLPSVDHQTPPGVSLENYRIYLNLLREYSDVLLPFSEGQSKTFAGP